MVASIILELGGIYLRIAVRYQSRGGNTKKVAEAIARKSGVVAKPLDPTETLSGVDLLFVGGGVYAGSLHKTVNEALASLTAEQTSGVAFFCTALAPVPETEGKLHKAVKDSSIAISEKMFQCPGKFLCFKRGKPEDSDLAQAEAFAKRTIEARRKTLDEIKWRG